MIFSQNNTTLQDRKHAYLLSQAFEEVQATYFHLNTHEQVISGFFRFRKTCFFNGQKRECRCVVFELKLIKSYLLVMAQILQETFFVCVSLSVFVCMFLLVKGPCAFSFFVQVQLPTPSYMCVCERYIGIIITLWGVDYMFYILDIWQVDSKHVSSPLCVCVYYLITFNPRGSKGLSR